MLPGTWETEAAKKASWDPGNESSRKSFLGSGKWKQQKRLHGTQKTEAAEKTSWDRGNGSNRKSFLRPGKRKQQKKLPGTWETEAAGKASWDLETTDWEKDRTRQIINDYTYSTFSFFLINIFFMDIFCAFLCIYGHTDTCRYFSTGKISQDGYLFLEGLQNKINTSLLALLV